MELAVYFANYAQLEDQDEALRSLDPGEIPSFVNPMVFAGDTSSREYYGNLIALQWLEAHLEHTGDDISRLYFGQEFCEHLIPDSAELLRAYYHSRQLGWNFTYTTGVCTEAALAAQERNLEALAGQDGEIEVVVNDWGLLRLLRRRFPGLVPVFGRLLHKQMRLYRFSSPTTPPPVNRNGISLPEPELRANQIAALRDTALADLEFCRELRGLGISRAEVDMTPPGIELPAHPDALAISSYYPWGYAAGGRNCLTAGVLDPAREFVVVDGPCPRPCQRFNKTAMKMHGDDILIQRGNTVFAFHSEYAVPYLNGQYPVSRVVFEPYIPM